MRRIVPIGDACGPQRVALTWTNSLGLWPECNAPPVRKLSGKGSPPRCLTFPDPLMNFAAPRLGARCSVGGIRCSGRRELARIGPHFRRLLHRFSPFNSRIEKNSLLFSLFFRLCNGRLGYGERFGTSGSATNHARRNSRVTHCLGVSRQVKDLDAEAARGCWEVEAYAPQTTNGSPMFAIVRTRL